MQLFVALVPQEMCWNLCCCAITFTAGTFDRADPPKWSLDLHVLVESRTQPMACLRRRTCSLLQSKMLEFLTTWYRSKLIEGVVSQDRFGSHEIRLNSPSVQPFAKFWSSPTTWLGGKFWGCSEVLGT